MSTQQRLPLGALLRNELTGCIYLVIKIDSYLINIVYNLCCIYDPNIPDQTLPLTFNFIVGDEKSHKLTVLNSIVRVCSDGTLIHSLSLIHEDQAPALFSNRDFMLRYLTACKFFLKNKKIFEVNDVDSMEKTALLIRQSTFFEKSVFKNSHILYTVPWCELIEDYTPHVPEDMDEQLYLSTIASRSYFAKTHDIP